VLQAILKGSHLPSVPKCPRAFHDLMKACWSDAPKARPTVAELHSRVTAVTTRLLRGSTDVDLGLNYVDNVSVWFWIARVRQQLLTFRSLAQYLVVGQDL
jgi:hypothetical protein